MKNTKHENGFTLIELLVVIAIISLLTTIILAALGGSKNKGNDAVKVRALQEVRSALQLYNTDNGYFPGGTSLAPLVTNKSISSINVALMYQGLYTNGTICNTAPCSYYHLAVPLSRTDNKVLNSDKDLNDTIINGTVDNCISGSASTPDRCYDVTP
jgi:general secretion pathway protein G